MHKFISYPIVLLLLFGTMNAQTSKKTPEYSKAGYFELANSGRQVFDFNVGWRFYKAAANNAETVNFDDSQWKVVNAPHGLELNSSEASGSVNYQGEAWYRKHFTAPSGLSNKRVVVHFEAIMGKCKIWLNGHLITSHFGGYLPFEADLTDKINLNGKNVLAIWTDNSDDAAYPPGKPQKTLDFSYFGGIYRDVWLVATDKLYITNANTADKKADGGVFIHHENVSKKKATVVASVHLKNDKKKASKISLVYILKDKQGKKVSSTKQRITIPAGQSTTITKHISVKNPSLWSPVNPYLYDLELKVLNSKGKTIDGVRERVGIRTIDFRGKDGFYLNGEPYVGKLMGANRHQDHGYIGNALPNSGQWRDALILKETGSDIVRAAHYPADPAFMDACDALGMFYIVATPGWQFWNKDPLFEQRVYQDIRNMVRRDRNYASVLMWEPILNETWYPPHFAEQTHNIVHEEYPYQGAFTVCDSQARGQEHFDVIYSHPFISKFFQNVQADTPENRAAYQLDYSKETRCIFTREFGDCVDDWNSHNSPSRVHRSWGEFAQLIQAKHYGNPDYIYTSWETLYDAPRQHIGGALWHPFDHQRGYHPDPFYGGITDVFRQPKYSYELFKSQRDAEQSEPMVFVANEMSPFSVADVTVFTNCDEVRLIVFEKDTIIKKANPKGLSMPHPAIVFKDVFDFIKVKNMHRANATAKASIVAQGLINGKVVATYKKTAALRPAKITLKVLDKGIPLVANASDIITVIASVTDKAGNVKRLNNSVIRFELEGEGQIVDNGMIQANPRKVEWGTAPVLIRSTLKSGKIKIKAFLIEEGVNSPIGGELVIESIKNTIPSVHKETSNGYMLSNKKSNSKAENEQELNNVKAKMILLQRELNNLKLKEVEKQQEEFEGKEKKK